MEKIDLLSLTMREAMVLLKEMKICTNKDAEMTIKTSNDGSVTIKLSDDVILWNDLGDEKMIRPDAISEDRYGIGLFEVGFLMGQKMTNNLSQEKK